MRTMKEIKDKINDLQNDDRIKLPDALIQINAPLALIQLSIEMKIAALEWVLGLREDLIIG